jgi:hypothetical protein
LGSLSLIEVATLETKVNKGENSFRLVQAGPEFDSVRPISTYFDQKNSLPTPGTKRDTPDYGEFR